MTCVKPNHVKTEITDFGNRKRKAIRSLKRNEVKHVSLQPKGCCKLVVMREGEYDYLPISDRVAEELIALGFGYDC